MKGGQGSDIQNDGGVCFSMRYFKIMSHYWRVYRITWKIINMIQLISSGELMCVIFDSNMYIFLYVFEESCFYSLVQPRHLQMSLGSLRILFQVVCSSKYLAGRDGVLSLSSFLKHVFEEILLLLIPTLKSFNKLVFVVSSRLVWSPVLPLPTQHSQQQQGTAKAPSRWAAGEAQPVWEVPQRWLHRRE